MPVANTIVQYKNATHKQMQYYTHTHTMAGTHVYAQSGLNKIGCEQQQESKLVANNNKSQNLWRATTRVKTGGEPQQESKLVVTDTTARVKTGGDWHHSKRQNWW